MKATFQLGLAVILLTLVILNASGVCAAVVAQPSHPCCPVKNTTPSCCRIAGIPAEPSAITLTEFMDLAVPVVIEDSPPPSLAYTPAAANDEDGCPPKHLFVAFHQLLI
jgi:hypothetical protein